MTAHLLVVRHGESTWNALRRWQGQADPPLSERGESQARNAATKLAALQPIDLVVTSSLQRARRTGELLAQAASVDLGDALPGLTERAAGAWEGLTRVEIDEQFPGYLTGGQRPAGYEEDAAIIARAVPALRELAGRHHGRRVVVVTHGGVLNALERHAEEVSDDSWQRIDNLVGRWFTHVGDDLRTRGPRVSLLTDSTPGAEADRGYA